MKKLLVILFVLIMIFLYAACSAGNTLEDAATEYFSEFPGSRMLTWDDLFSRIDEGDEPFILSIRQCDVYNKGHIIGAYNAVWGADLAEKVSMLPTDKPIFVYCSTGQIAGQAVALLNMLGIEAYSVKSGFNIGAMAVEGYEAYVETIVNELPDSGAKFNKAILAYVEEYLYSVANNNNFMMAAYAVTPLIESGSITVMDIRSADDFNAAHIEGAVNVPFGKGMQRSFADFEGKKIIVICYSGQAAGQTVAVLRALGYDAVALESGMDSGWIAESNPAISE